MTDLLDKTYGSRRAQAQQNRNREAFRLLEDGKLQPGEIYGLVTGNPAPLSPDNQNPVLTSGRRTTCLDCGEALEHLGSPLRSQPRRCAVCGRLRRKRHNDAQARKKEAQPAPEQGADDLQAASAE